jgi:hypothetical protein
MQVRWTDQGHRQRGRASLGLAPVLVFTAVLAVSGCSHPAGHAGAGTRQCGTSRSPANVPIAVEVDHGSVSCTTAMAVEKDYAEAIDGGKAPGNGGGGPVPVNGWICQGFPTPQVLKTGDASKCTKDGSEILASLSAPS